MKVVDDIRVLKGKTVAEVKEFGIKTPNNTTILLITNPISK